MKRVDTNKPYFYLFVRNGAMIIGCEIDMRTLIDTLRYDAGNYFSELSEAKEYREFINELLRERHNG